MLKTIKTKHAFTGTAVLLLFISACSRFTDAYYSGYPARADQPDSLFVINDDGALTYAHSATLTVNMQDVLEMRFRNESGEWSNWRSFAKHIPWDIVRSTGIRTVGGEFRDSRGDVYRSDDSILYIERISRSGSSPGERLGWSISASGDGSILIAGAETSERGRAFIYRWSHAGWEEIELIAVDGVTGDGFGYSVSISSDGALAAVGARDRTEARIGQGAVYLFARDMDGSGTWGQMKKLTAGDVCAYARFGQSLALSPDGSTLVVGASGQRVGTNDEQGQVYVFNRDHGGADNWGLLANLVANNGGYQDQLGHSVAVSGNGSVVAAGAPWKNDRRGACYIFRYSSGAYSQSPEIVDSVGAENDYMGQSLTLSSDGGSLLAGADGYDPGGVANAGCVLEFMLNGGIYEYRSRIVAASPSVNDRFGYTLKLSPDGSHLAIGAHLAETGGIENAGLVFMYQKSGLDFVLHKTLSAPDAEGAQMFGNDIAFSTDGGIVFAASFMDDIITMYDDRGSVYVFRD